MVCVQCEGASCPSLLRAGCFICDEKLSLRELLLTAAYKLSGRELPLLDLWIWSFSNDPIDVFSNMLCGNRAPHINALVQQRDARTLRTPKLTQQRTVPNENLHEVV
jgi:hypothetical protein